MGQAQLNDFLIPIITLFLNFIALGAMYVKVHVQQSERIAVLEAKMENKADKDLLLQKMDEMRVAIEDKIETEINKLRLNGRKELHQRNLDSFG